ncbi:MAG: type 4a pilus biogenesis protein PilO [Candidatus Pacebacteria bacterium]|nr:type 4a pilus biogenesis protein PilO [Candidatus Paceibacterota bacterium]
MPTKARDIQLLIYFIICVLIFCVAYFFVYPSLIEVKKAKKESVALIQILKEKEETLEEFNGVAAKYKTNSAKIKKIEGLLLDENSDKLLMLIHFDVLASRNKMSVSSFSFGEVEGSESNLGVLPVSLTVDGSYGNFKGFLDDVAKSIPLMEVETINFSVGEEGETGEKTPPNMNSFSLVIKVYTKSIVEVSKEEGAAATEGENINQETTPQAVPQETQNIPQ